MQYLYRSITNSPLRKISIKLSKSHYQTIHQLFSTNNSSNTNNFFNKKPDLYKLLDVVPNAKPKQIQYAYYKLLKQYQAKTNDEKLPGTEFTELLNRAYIVLSDEKLRKKYDQENGFLLTKQAKQNVWSSKNEGASTFSDSSSSRYTQTALREAKKGLKDYHNQIRSSFTEKAIFVSFVAVVAVLLLSFVKHYLQQQQNIKNKFLTASRDKELGLNDRE